MAGIYIHIPFCKSRCIYCDFFSTTDRSHLIDAYVETVCHELYVRNTELRDQGIRSVYFGGGTPSRLYAADVGKILDVINRNYNLLPDAEITFEANPDDVSEEYVKMLCAVGVNRLSMGVQSFDDDILRFLNRRHSSDQARHAVAYSHNAGICNVSIDLIYGLPGQSMDSFLSDVDTAISLGVSHLSAYSLSYEEGTRLWKMRNSGDVCEIPEDTSSAMYDALCEKVKERGFEHYEISNFSKPGMRSRHNSGYWDGTAYMGVGAAAHSYNGKSVRRWNVSDVNIYIENVEGNRCFWEQEILSPVDRYNEMVQTRIRTADGLELHQIETCFGESMRRYLVSMALPHVDAGRMSLDSEHSILRLTHDGIFVSDDIVSDLFFVD